MPTEPPTTIEICPRCRVHRRRDAGMTPFLSGLALGFILGALVVLAIGAIEAGREARAWHTTPDDRP